MTTFRIRPLQTADRPAVLELLRQALGETELLQRTADLFAWKHLDNPFGPSLMLVAEDGDGLMGFRALMRWELSTADGNRLLCMRAVDTATHPRARRRGVFTRLTRAAVQTARDEGVDLIFNTPNPRSGAGYLNMGWTKVGPIGVLVRPLLGGSWRQTESLPSPTCGDAWDDRAVTHRAPRGLRTPRTAEYLRWRFGQHPSARYRVVGDSNCTLILRSNIRRGRGELVVSEMFGTRSRRLLRTLGRTTNAAYMVGWFSAGSPERAAALRSGLVPVPGMRALTLFARPLRELTTDVSDLGAWDISLGDLELL